MFTKVTKKKKCRHSAVRIAHPPDATFNHHRSNPFTLRRNNGFPLQHILSPNSPTHKASQRIQHNTTANSPIQTPKQTTRTNLPTMCLPSDRHAPSSGAITPLPRYHADRPPPIYIGRAPRARVPGEWSSLSGRYVAGMLREDRLTIRTAGTRRPAGGGWR